MEMEAVCIGVIICFLPQVLEQKNEVLFEIAPTADNIVSMSL